MDRIKIYQFLEGIIKQKGACFLLLIDPDKQLPEDARDLAQKAVSGGVDALLIGGSFLFTDHFHQTLAVVKSSVKCPIILFPGVSGPESQISSKADAILLLSLISGRNADYLIGEQVRSALWIDRCAIETIPTGYMLIESGRVTTAEFISGTRPIPRDKGEIAMIHALAAQQLGMKLIYLEAGSGAQNPVPDEMITLVSNGINIPVIVGGGIRDAETAHQKVKAGAQIIVIGTVIEHQPNQSLVQEFSKAIHWRLDK